MINPIVCGLDTETTGLLHPDHRFVEVYAGLWQNQTLIDAFDERINPGRGIDAAAQAVHHIGAADLYGKPDWSAVAPKLHAHLLRADYWVIHNAGFDWAFLKQEFERIDMTMPVRPVICTMLNAPWATFNGKNPRLEELCFACGVDYDPALAHAAAFDVDVMMQCYWRGLKFGFYQEPELPAIALAA